MLRAVPAAVKDHLGAWTALALVVFAAAAPPKIQLHDRSYIRSAGGATVDPGMAGVGETEGGGQIYAAPATPAGTTPTWVVVLSDRRVTGYALSGGP